LAFAISYLAIGTVEDGFEEASLPAIVCGWYQRWPSARDRASLARLWSTQDLADARQDALRLGASSSRF
jgi:hypothetical protein